MVSILIKNKCNPGTAINILIYFVHELDQIFKWFIKLNFSVAIRASLSVTWDQALFSFRFENNIPAGKAKRKKILAVAVRESVWQPLKLGLISG